MATFNISLVYVNLFLLIFVRITGIEAGAMKREKDKKMGGGA